MGGPTISDIASRLVAGDIKYKSLDDRLQRAIGKDNALVYNAIGVPLVHALAKRSWNSGDSKVYSKSQIDSIFGAEKDRETPVQTSSNSGIGDEPDDYVVLGDGKGSNPNTAKPAKPVEKGVAGRFKSLIKSLSLRTNKWVPIGIAGAAGAGIGALIAYAVIRRRNRKKKALVKKALFTDGIARMISPEYDLMDKAVTATDVDDYRNFNKYYEEVARKRFAKGNLDKFVPSSGNAFTWDRPFAFPGDRARPVRITAEASPKSKGYDAGHAQVWFGNGSAPYGINADLRTSLATYIASTMLPVGRSSVQYSDEPSIGNMAYDAPAIMGMFARDNGLSKEDIENISTNGLDNAVMDAVRHTFKKYPAARNIASAYVNGGFGDVRHPERFGMAAPLWDYGAKAPTPEGTNMLKKVVHDIGAAGGYGGYVLSDKNGQIPMPSKYQMDSVRLDGHPKHMEQMGIDLGSGMGPEKFRHLARTEDSEYFREMVEGLKNDPKELSRLRHNYGLPEDVNAEVVASNVMRSILDGRDSLKTGKTGERYRNDVNNALKWMSKDRDNTYRFLEAQKSTAPRTGYDKAKEKKHLNELLRFFDNVGPSIFTPQTVLGKDMVFHPVGGIIPNAERAWKDFIPYIDMDKELIQSIDDATGGLVNEAKGDAVGAAKKRM